MLILLVLVATLSSQELCPERTADEGDETYLDCQCDQHYAGDQTARITESKERRDTTCEGVVIK